MQLHTTATTTTTTGRKLEGRLFHMEALRPLTKSSSRARVIRVFSLPGGYCIGMLSINSFHFIDLIHMIHLDHSGLLG